MSDRQLFVFWQFDGNNTSVCSQKCPYCYGGKKSGVHSWIGDVAKWEEAFARLDRQHGDKGIYFVFSYGESMEMQGFYDCVEMIGKHPNWTLCIVTNASQDMSRLISSRLVKDHRLFISACWHPLGANPDRVRGWEIFKRHVLELRGAGVRLNVMYLWYNPQIQWFPEVFQWCDNNNIRVSVRRFVEYDRGLKVPFVNKHLFGKYKLTKYSEAAKGYIYAYAHPKVIKYGLNLVSPKGRECLAGKDLILVKPNGDVSLCADMEDTSCLGNVFDVNFKLSKSTCKCPSKICGGDYGMLHLIDEEFGVLPDRLRGDTFVSIALGEAQTEYCPVIYQKRSSMLKYLEMIKCEKQQ